jgi:hypothetical protein
MIRETRLGGCAMQNRQCIWFQLSYWHAFSFFTFALLHGSMVSLLDKATLPYKLLGTGSVVTNVICGLGIMHCICSLLAYCAELKAITLKWLNLCLLCTLSLVHSSWFGCVSHNFRFFFSFHVICFSYVSPFIERRKTRNVLTCQDAGKSHTSYSYVARM